MDPPRNSRGRRGPAPSEDRVRCLPAVVVEHQNQGVFSSIQARSTSSDGHAHALQAARMDRTLHRCLPDGVNHGKKSSKVLQDCTICRSCREAVIGPVVLK